jgi:hypothetical protein
VIGAAPAWPGAHLVRCIDETDSSCDSVGIDVPASSWRPADLLTTGAARSKASGIASCFFRRTTSVPYVRRNKTDRTDTKGILEASRNEEIRLVPVKTVDQQVLTSLHRLRSGWMTERTARLNALRGFLEEDNPGRHTWRPRRVKRVSLFCRHVEDLEHGFPRTLIRTLIGLEAPEGSGHSLHEHLRRPANTGDKLRSSEVHQASSASSPCSTESGLFRQPSRPLSRHGPWRLGTLRCRRLHTSSPTARSNASRKNGMTARRSSAVRRRATCETRLPLDPALRKHRALTLRPR